MWIIRQKENYKKLANTEFQILVEEVARGKSLKYFNKKDIKYLSLHLSFSENS